MDNDILELLAEDLTRSVDVDISVASQIVNLLDDQGFLDYDLLRGYYGE